MTMGVGHAHPIHRRVSKVKFNQHGRRVSDDPCIVIRLDSYDRWCSQLHSAAVRILDGYLATRQKTNVYVPA
jgi:hypothetical protein